MGTPRYLILGTSHEIQWAGGSPNASILTFVSELRSTIRHLATSHKVSLIAEEAPHDCGTIAQEIAESLGIQYIQIDMRPIEWDTAGIRLEMEARDRLHMQDVGAKECRLTRADDIREDYWLDRIVGEELGPVLVVCGCAHVRWLAEKVKQRYGQEAERLYSPEFLRNRTVAEFYLDANGSPQTCKKPNQTP